MLHSHRVSVPEDQPRSFAEGDRVTAPARPGFPAGTVVKRLTHGHLLVRWDGNVLETMHPADLELSDGGNLRN